MDSLQTHKDSPNSHLTVLYMIIASVILTPDIQILGAPSVRLEQILVVTYLFLRLGSNKKMKRSQSRFTCVYAGFSIIIVLSILVGSLKGIPPGIRDFFELYKILVYGGMFLATGLIVKSEADKTRVLEFIIICLLVSVAIAVQQYFNLFGLNERYVPLIAPTQYRTLVSNYPFPRVVGMTSNPNVYALMPGIGAIISWGLYLSRRERKHMIFLLAFIIGVLMTLSRSGFLFMLSGVITYTLLHFRSGINIRRLLSGRINKKMFRLSILAFIILISFGVIIFRYLPENLTWRLLRGLELASDSSFQARLRNWQEHIDYFKLSPVFGIGPAKSIDFMSYADNEWLLFLRQYGVVGCLYIIFLFLQPVLKRRKSVYKYLYISILAGCSLYMIPAIVYHSFQIMPLIFILIGLI